MIRNKLTIAHPSRWIERHSETDRQADRHTDRQTKDPGWSGLPRLIRPDPDLKKGEFLASRYKIRDGSPLLQWTHRQTDTDRQTDTQKDRLTDRQTQMIWADLGRCG